MKRSLLVISLWMLVLAAAAQTAADSLPQLAYDQRVRRYHQRWDALIPTQFVIQNAGNMGVISMGSGWSYGRRRQWETLLLMGYIPPYQSHRGKLTTTLKQNYVPWSLPVRRGWSVEPITASIYLNTVYGHEFWRSQPGRYPDSYYDFLSTKFRLNAALGQRLTKTIPHNQRKFLKSISAFYELSSCDLYLRAALLDGSVSLSDVVGLSLGVRLQWF